MDVHPPHEPVHTWRDFAIHLTIVTIGLFIALMLEGSIEWLHHRHLVHEARANIREEIQDNQTQLKKNLVSLKQDEDRLTKDLQQLAQIRATHSFEHKSLSYMLEWSSFSDSAWRSARDTGALSFMDYKQVQDIADVYGQQDIVNENAQKLFSEQPRAISPIYIAGDPGKTSDGDVAIIQQRTADVLVTVRVLEQVMGELDQAYTERLKRI